MNEDQIESFLAVVQEGSMIRAAERRYISHPALRGQIDALEADLGVRLLNRSPQGCSLTSAGDFFSKRISNVLAEVKSIRQEIKAVDRSVKGTIRICVNPGIPIPHLEEACQTVMELYPDLTVSFVPIPYRDRVTALRQGTADLFFYHQTDEITGDATLRIWPIEYADTSVQEASQCCGCLMGKTDPLGSKSLLQIPDLAGRSVAIPVQMLFSSLVSQAKDMEVELNVQVIDTSTYDVIDFCNNGGLYLIAEGNWNYKALQYVRLEHVLPAHCIVTRADPSPEVEQAVKALLEEYGSGWDAGDSGEGASYPISTRLPWNAKP